MRTRPAAGSDSRPYKDAKLARVKLRFMTHALMENRNGLIVDVETTRAIGNALDSGTTRHATGAVSLKCQKRSKPFRQGQYPAFPPGQDRASL